MKKATSLLLNIFIVFLFFSQSIMAIENINTQILSYKNVRNIETEWINETWTVRIFGFKHDSINTVYPEKAGIAAIGHSANFFGCYILKLKDKSGIFYSYKPFFVTPFPLVNRIIKNQFPPHMYWRDSFLEHGEIIIEIEAIGFGSITIDWGYLID